MVDRRTEKDTHTEENRRIDRRSYLKGTGLTLATAGLGIAATGTAAARTLDVSDGELIDPYLSNIDDGEAITIPPGRYEFDSATISADNWSVDGQGCTFDPRGNTDLTLRGNDWSFGGVRFNVPGDKQVQTWVRGNDWRIHNCAWDGPNTNVNYLIHPGVDEGHSAEIDQCWFGGGCGPDRSESAIKGNGHWNGDIWMRRSYFYQNGVYGVQTINPPDMRGCANYDRCYFENCYLDCVRTGNYYGKTCYVKDCVMVYDSREETPAVQGRGVKAYRGVWAFWGDVEVTNCDISVPFGRTLVTNRRGDPTITMDGGNLEGDRDTDGVTVLPNVGSDPSTSPPDACVTSVEEAITGSKSGDSSTDSSPDPSPEPLPHTITITGSTSEEESYEFTVSGDVRKSTINGASINDDDAISDGTVTGQVFSSSDSYAFGGEITDFAYSGNPTVEVDGEAVDPATLGSLPHTITITGSTSEEETYEFTVSGDVRKSTINGASINDDDAISDGTVTGQVFSSSDSYAFGGEITDFAYSGNPTVEVDGEAVDPAALGPDTATGTRFVVEAAADAPTFEYEFESTGPVGKVRDGSDLESEDNDTITQNGDGTYSVTGVVGNGYGDSYTIDGDVTAFSATTDESDFTLRFDGQPVSIAELTGSADSGEQLPNSITVDTIERGQTVDYRFEVTGEVAPASDGSVESSDTISGGTVTASIEDDVDRYRFSGDIVDIFVDGPATIQIDDAD